MGKLGWCIPACLSLTVPLILASPFYVRTSTGGLTNCARGEKLRRVDGVGLTIGEP